MKKITKHIPIVIIMLLCIPLGILLGQESGRLYEASPLKGIYALASMTLSLIVAFYFSVITHEGGHLIFGLLSGYRFSSFRISGLMLIKQDGKMKLKRFKLAGTGGQCLMCPPEPKNGEYPVLIYNLGGVILNIFFAVVAFVLYYTLDFIPVLSLLLLLIGIFSAFFAISNGIPISAGGISNDGMNALHLSKDKTAAAVFRNQLLMNAAQAGGARISEMPDEWFALPEGADMQNVHCASIAVFAASRPLDRGDTVEAERQIYQLLHSGYNVIGLHKNLLTCDLIYCRLVNNPTVDVSHLITEELKKIMRMMNSYPSIIRTEYTLALLQEKNEKKAEEIMSKYEKITRKFPYSQEIDAERNFMLRALEIYKSTNNAGQN